ncbi:DUF3107 domain-containing protein [Microbacterium betulae]|uniref:DUF3107 domain-containing protein n=1 Tax=Microbacterium betulae TaxID=2981139 RepID=A0AA97FJ53_9MICO|nr:DUF3107 domain-containing protein [Microbacterium sp. AB]WOF24456.1 DUF3107 domain-containing protein [Microbacterium sp. AB]
MEIRIGITNSGRELTFETSDSAAEVKAAVAAALDEGASHLSFTDVKGNAYFVPSANLAFVEIGTEETRRVGFVA